MRRDVRGVPGESLSEDFSQSIENASDLFF
jgi:hypothetical protein